MSQGRKSWARASQSESHGRCGAGNSIRVAGIVIREDKEFIESLSLGVVLDCLKYFGVVLEA